MIGANEFLKTEMNVLSRGFIPPEEVEAAERQPLAMARSHISWGGVIAGSLLTVSLLVFSCSLAYACGIPAFTGSGSYGVGAAIWSICSAIIAFGAGGWLAACLASTLDSRYGFLQGVVVWALTIPLLLTLTERLSLLAGNGVVDSNLREMALIAPRIGGSWGVVLSLAAGLVAAMIGGTMIHMSSRRNVTATPSV